MKTRFLTLLFCLLSLWSFACPLCRKRQPKGFANITHGTGPEGLFDYVVFYSSIGVVVLTFGLLIYYSVKPRRAVHPPLIDWNHG
ncbi:hypothetical protein [Fibrella aquatilis]|uniref:Uncharacterized protein n=1 Tax=Fibrella aquatilis TaxID=2817059 RepID=A0A939G2Q3_9BACT|nr:hypothetical protein [Fibrella aquatilis]MBO0929370.1 hypothetical protein [Fibrella aquatilis]